MASIISQITKIKNFGSFKDFSCDNKESNVFKKINLFYGYNGSGKTTLTRLFSCLNDGSNVLLDNAGVQIVDYSGCEIKIKCNSKSIVSFDNSPIKNKIKIFNVDFVENNLKLTEGTAKKLSAIIGKHNIAVKDEINKLEKQKEKLYTPENQLKAQLEVENASKTYKELKTKIATDIRTYLHIAKTQSYQAHPHFEIDLKNYNPAATPLTEEDKKRAGDIYLGEKPKIDHKYGEALDNINTLLQYNYTEIFNLLKKPIKREAAQIKEEVIKWIEEGAAFHTDDHDICKFCGQNISAETWTFRTAKIQELIKKDDKFEKLESRLLESKKTVAEQTKTLTSFSLELEEIQFFTKEFFDSYQASKTKFNAAFYKFSAALEKLSTAIEEKIKNKDVAKPFDNIEDFKSNVVDLSNSITYLKEAIHKNNSTVENSDNLKKENKQKVINFYIQQHKAEIDSKKEDEENKKKALEKVRQDLQRIDDAIKSKNALLENQEENIKRINELLRQMLDIGLEIKLEPGSSEYLLERKINGKQNIQAKHLSEGEKNIIAFLYFLVSLDSSSDENKKDEIIVIDDPVSSLDSNNLFVLQHLIVDTLNKYGQQFFLTHNFYFFAKVREAIKASIKASKNETTDTIPLKIFEIKHDKTKGSLIKDASTYVKKYISEYMSIMGTLHEKFKALEEEPDVTTANLIRRALEVFLYFKDTTNSSLFKKLQKMAGNEVKYQSLLNICNAFSHSTVGDTADLSYIAGKKEIKILFGFIKENDAEHFAGFKIKLDNNLLISGLM